LRVVSGLFVWPSLARKGRATFLRDRPLRIGLPFALAAPLAPLAYYPAYRVSAADPGFAAFLGQWLSLASIGAWPAGPAWFVWVLLVFDGVAAGIHRFASVAVGGPARLASGPLRRPRAFFAVLIAASAVAYLPMRVAFGAGSWLAAGPFAVQTSRILLYLVQYALLPLSLPAAAKAAIVFAGALGLSWSAIAALRRIPAVARVI